MTPKPTLVLTRPRAASEREAAQYEGPAIVSPVIRIVPTGEKVSLDGFAGVILTSTHTVPLLPHLGGMPVYCVGERTAEASGGDVRLVALDAEELVATIEARGPLLHARGRNTSGNVAGRLTKAGIETVSKVVYDQVEVPLSDEAKAALHGEAPVVLPLWSPRSAALVRGQVGDVSSAVRVIALSPAVAKAWGAPEGADVAVCDAPTTDSMKAQIAAATER